MTVIRRVMLVDDDPDIRFIAELSLSRVGGWDVVAASSGPEALALLDAEERPDVLLLDMIMPGMDGAAVMLAVKQRPELADLPVIFLTGKTQAEELERYLALGASGLIEKPFDPMTLAAVVREIVSGKRA